jgi:hypothetical protein
VFTFLNILRLFPPPPSFPSFPCSLSSAGYDATADASALDVRSSEVVSANGKLTVFATLGGITSDEQSFVYSLGSNNGPAPTFGKDN